MKSFSPTHVDHFPFTLEVNITGWKHLGNYRTVEAAMDEIRGSITGLPFRICKRELIVEGETA